MEIFKSELQKPGVQPGAILITGIMTYWYPGVFEAIKILRNYFKNIPIILGGIYPTLCYEHAVKYSGADYVVRGGQGIEVLRLVDQLKLKLTGV